MPGTRSNAFPVHGTVTGYSNAAVAAAQVLTEMVMIFPGRLGAIKANAQTAGGTTVVDVQLNGTSVWTAAGNRPTGTSGEFANPPADIRAFVPGDRISINVISGTAARLMVTVGLELA